MNTIYFKISMPTDEEFIGRECNEPTCRRYFRVHASSIKNQMYCPYCNRQFSNNELHTKGQLKYLEEARREKAREFACGEIDKMFGRLARNIRGNKFVQLKHQPINYHAKQILPRYKEHKVDSELICPKCSFRFQVFGIFGFCPGCQTENMLIYDANLAIIKAEISQDNYSLRSLRHAYNDLISTFENFCQKKASLVQDEKPSFQELFPTRNFFKKHFAIDIFDSLSTEQLLCLRRVFQKRHAYQHSKGIINDRFIRKIPEDKNLLDTKAILSFEEFDEGANILRIVLGKLVNGRI